MFPGEKVQARGARFKNVLVLTPEGCSRYNHTRALRAYCDNLYEFNYAEPLKIHGIVELREQLARLVVEKKIDVFFIALYGDDYLVPPEFLLELKKSTRIVLWCGDDEVNFRGHSRYYAQVADAVVTTDFFSVAAYRALGVPAVLCFSNLAADRYPVLNLPRDIDVSFVGHCRKADRPRYLDFLAANGIEVRSFGYGSKGGFVSDEEMARIFSRSKINLNFSRLEDGAVRSTGHKGRTIEVAMTGSFCLSEYYPALPRIFDIGREIDCFTDQRSLLEKVRYYLANEGAREIISTRAHARALRDYENGPCFSRVMDELAAAFSGPVRPAVIAKSSEFKKRQIGGLIVHGLSLLRRGRLTACVKTVPELFQYGPWLFLVGAAEGLARGFEIVGRKLRDPMS